MQIRRLSWAQLTRGGVPLLFVLRPMGGLDPPAVGTEYPAPGPSDRFAMTRARQWYEQRRIGTREELDRASAKKNAAHAAARKSKSRKEKRNDRD
jgi:hypothetical protein